MNMKRFLLSILCCLLAVVSGYAEEVTFNFKKLYGNATLTSISSKTVDGITISYAKNSAGSAPGFNQDGTLRLYFNASGNGGSATFTTDGTKKITKAVITATTTPTVKYSVDDGNLTSGTWSSKTMTISGISASNTLMIQNANTTNTQLRITEIVLTVESNSSGDSGEPEAPVAPNAPTLTASCSFYYAMNVEITNIPDGPTVYYTTDGTDPSVSNGTAYTASFKITETTTVKAIAIKGELTSEVVSETYTKNEVQEGEVVDVLTRELTGVTSGSTNYSSWTGKTSNSSAVYAGNSAGSNDAIQLRSNNNNSGIVTTVSGGKVKKIIVEWQESTGSDRVLDVYGKTTAYSAATDLYASETQGTKLRSIDRSSTEFTINGDYEYIGLRSKSGAMYLTSITIIWDTNTTQPPTVPAAPTIIPNSSEFVGYQEITILAEDGADIYYTLDGSEPQEGTNKYTDPFTITGTTTVKAIAVNTVGASEVTTATYTRVAASPTITFEGNGEFKGSLVVTIEPAAGTTAYYTLNGNDPDSNSDVCPETLTLKADATLKVIAYEGELVSPLYTKNFTLKESASSGSGSSSNTAILVEDVANLKVGDEVVIVASDYDFALSTTQNNNNRGQVAITKNGDNVTWEEGVQILTLEEGTTSGSFAFYTGSGYLYAASSSANNLKTQATNNANGSWSISIVDGVASIQANGSYTRNVMRYNQTSDIFSCYAEDNSQYDVSLYKVNHATVEPYVLNVSAAGWATLFLDYNAEIPEGVTCYVISGFEGDKATLTEVTSVLPKETGVIVKANPGDYTFEATGATADIESYLSGSVNNEYVNENVVKEAYVLSIVDGEVGLYKAQMAGGVFLNNANKAYLPASALTASAQGTSGFKFRFDNQTTGIEGAPALNTAKAIYDLSGRKVNDITAPGLYIVNGKKVMVK